MTEKTFEKPKANMLVDREIQTDENGNSREIGADFGKGKDKQIINGKEITEFNFPKKEDADAFDCEIIETDSKRKERFAKISRENWDKIKDHPLLISASSTFFMEIVLREGELGAIKQSEGWLLRIIADDDFDKIPLILTEKTFENKLPCGCTTDGINIYGKESCSGIEKDYHFKIKGKYPEPENPELRPIGAEVVQPEVPIPLKILDDYKQKVRDALERIAKKERTNLGNPDAPRGARGLNENTFCIEVLKELGL